MILSLLGSFEEVTVLGNYGYVIKTQKDLKEHSLFTTCDCQTGKI